MRWITFFILLYLMSALQVSHLGGIPPKSASEPIWPYVEFLPMLAVFYALYASEPAALFAALICGLAYDLLAADFAGTNLIPLALVGWIIVRIRLSIFREHFLSQLLITLLAILTFALFAVIFRWRFDAPMEGHSAWQHFTFIAGNAVYTAIVAPVVFYILFRFEHLLGFTPQGPRTRGHN